MSTSRRRLAAIGNRIGVLLHRVAGGRLDAWGDTTVLMITSPGRRTGLPRSTMVRYLEHDGGYLVWGTGSGSPRDPDWFRNLRHTSRARVEIGRDAQDVDVEELTGAERDRVWREVVLAQAPGVARYERKAGRVIPVAVLRPVRPA
ncbi:MAG TPA: nitroreductase/quinone reductase family protein [Nocardioides sp.]|nr:nitroreductase/quinone reductase family protein [Nocardioides sp.]